VVVIFVVVVLIIGDDVLAATKFNEHAASTAIVEAKRKLLFSAELPVLDVDAAAAAAAVVEVNRNGDAGNGCIPAVVDKVRHDIVGEDGIFCRFGARTIVEAEEAVVVPVEVDIILLFRARHDDDNRAERVAVHAAQDAMIRFLMWYNIVYTSSIITVILMISNDTDCSSGSKIIE
jgi:hypothetical protein